MLQLLRQNFSTAIAIGSREIILTVMIGLRIYHMKTCNYWEALCMCEMEIVNFLVDLPLKMRLTFTKMKCFYLPVTR